MFTLALIGRTNVGKSSLFNRLIGESKALVSAIAHTTRDRITGTTMWRGVDLRFIDTGGTESFYAPQIRGGIEEEIRKQAELAMHEADALLLVVDAREGILPGERTIARELRTRGKPIIVVWNKAETARVRAQLNDAAALGLGDAVATSAVTGMGVGDLLDAIMSHQPIADSPKQPTASLDNPSAHDDRPLPLRVAIVGEPNVGKSSLINAILGREEVIVHPEPFTTRDVRDIELDAQGTTVILLDTAGIRRAAVRATRGAKTRIEAIERLAVGRSMRAIERSEVAVLVLDGLRPATRHVKQLADAIARTGRPCVVVVNKCDLLPSIPDHEALAHHVQRQLAALSWALVLPTSARTGMGVPTVIPAALRAATAWRRTLDMAALTAVHALVKRRIPVARTAFGKKRSHVVELQQLDAAPPRFLLVSRRNVKLPKAIPAIVERALRESADFAGTPIRITVKSMKI